MREIKFRAWDKVEQDFIYGEPLFGFFPSVGESEENFKSFNENYNLMQYTGLKDKNGKEIYEGDIVEVQHLPVSRNENKILGFIERDNKFYTQNIVEWVETGFIFIRTPKFKKCRPVYSRSFITKNEKYFKVIGNIYENKELLDER